jgi:hypothetical protein
MRGQTSKIRSAVEEPNITVQLTPEEFEEFQKLQQEKKEKEKEKADKAFIKEFFELLDMVAYHSVFSEHDHESVELTTAERISLDISCGNVCYITIPAGTKVNVSRMWNDSHSIVIDAGCVSFQVDEDYIPAYFGNENLKSMREMAEQ